MPDAALEQQLALAARRGDRSAVIFGNAHEDPAPLPGHPTPGHSSTDHPAPGHPASGYPASSSWMYQKAGYNPPYRYIHVRCAEGSGDPRGQWAVARGLGPAGPLRERLAAHRQVGRACSCAVPGAWGS